MKLRAFGRVYRSDDGFNWFVAFSWRHRRVSRKH